MSLPRGGCLAVWLPFWRQFCALLCTTAGSSAAAAAAFMIISIASQSPAQLSDVH